MNGIEETIREYLRLKIEVERIRSERMEPDSSVLERLSYLENRIRGYGYNPEEIFAGFVNRAGTQSNGEVNMEDVIDKIFQGISKKVTKIRPIKINDSGYNRNVEKMEETEEGMIDTTEKPLIIAACGKKISEEQIGGRCDVCTQYECVEHVFFCFNQACKKTLCFKHTFFFNDGERNLPFCLEDYRKTVLRDNIWYRMEKLKRENRG